MISKRYQKVFDDYSDSYFFYDTHTGQSQWTAPLGFSDIPHVPESLKASTPRPKTPLDEASAATRIQNRIRTYLARSRLKKLLSSVYEKYYDPEMDAYYFYNRNTGDTSWNAPLGIEDVPVSS